MYTLRHHRTFLSIGEFKWVLRKRFLTKQPPRSCRRLHHPYCFEKCSFIILRCVPCCQVRTFCFISSSDLAHIIQAGFILLFVSLLIPIAAIFYTNSFVRVLSQHRVSVLWSSSFIFLRHLCISAWVSNKVEGTYKRSVTLAMVIGL